MRDELSTLLARGAVQDDEFGHLLGRCSWHVSIRDESQELKGASLYPVTSGSDQGVSDG